MKNSIKILLLFISLNLAAQQGGMWIPSQLKGMNEKEMKALGSEISAKDIYHIKKPSLKDAIVHFNGGCTAEVISKKGLLLTNHHCGFGAIQSHSTTEHDYLTDGFWAYKWDQELKNPGMTVTFIKRIDDVTKEVLKGISDNLSEKEKKDIISQTIKKIVDSAKKEDWQGAKVKPFYKGNKYYLFITEQFKDIRLVGAPPSSIGKFGADTDNWMWPRHTGDFSLFRIYANKNNRPAVYSESNVPYKPNHSLPVSLDGVEEGDFTLVFGFPGRTNEYLPSVALDQIVNKLNPAKIEIRDEALKIVDKYMRNDKAIKIKYASKFASIANYWKKWIGENQGIKKSKAIEQKRALETVFQEKVNGESKYKNLLSDFDKLYKNIEEVSFARDLFIETTIRNVELLNITFRLYQLEMSSSKGESVFNTKKAAFLKRFKGFYKNYSSVVDKEVFEKLVAMYFKNNPKKYMVKDYLNLDVAKLTNDIYSNSNLLSYKNLSKLLDGSMREVLKKLNSDKAYQFGKRISEMFYYDINPTFHDFTTKISAVQKTYMKALMEHFPNERFFPDANSTLRVTYGKVKGYQQQDGVYFKPVSYLKGVTEKYKPKDYEFDVSQKLLDLYDTKNYGNYAYKGKMPINFLGTNHTTGGNSGSPVIDAKGNLIGLNFDRVWEGTMSDYNYDAEICRNIMVDVRYIMFIIDKYAGVERIIKEIDFVHPK
jgi:hypothetical protein